MLKKIFRLSGEDLKKFFSQKYKKIGDDIFLIYYQKMIFLIQDLPFCLIKRFSKKQLKEIKLEDRFILSLEKF